MVAKSNNGISMTALVIFPIKSENFRMLYWCKRMSLISKVCVVNTKWKYRMHGIKIWSSIIRRDIEQDSKATVIKGVNYAKELQATLSSICFCFSWTILKRCMSMYAHLFSLFYSSKLWSSMPDQEQASHKLLIWLIVSSSLDWNLPISLEQMQCQY